MSLEKNIFSSKIEPGMIDKPSFQEIIWRKLNELEMRISEVDKKFNESEKYTKLVQNFVLAVTIGMMIVFAITTFDYFCRGNDRYEKLKEEVNEIKDNNYTKSDIDKKIVDIEKFSGQKVDDFKNCLEKGGWRACF